MPVQLDVGAALLVLVGTPRRAISPSQVHLRQTALQSSTQQCAAVSGNNAHECIPQDAQEEAHDMRSILCAIVEGGAGLAGRTW